MSAIKINDSTVILLVVLLLWIFFFGCATAPTSAPVMEISGDAEFARLLESIRVKGDLPAVFGAVIINGEIYLTAAVGTRKIGTENWEKLIGWPLTSANYALGWYDLKTKDGEKVLYHGSATKSFIADVYVSPNYGSGILLATNARTSHIPLYEGAKRINAQYSLKITLP